MRICREAWPTAVGAAGLAALLGVTLHPLFAAPPALFAAFTLWFFRDPERAPPAGSDLLLSPADGRILQAGPATVSIFMNVFDVHVCRAPIGGRVSDLEHTSGRFLAAFRDEAPSQNERLAIVIDDGRRRVRFVLIAGLIARRIVCHATSGARVGAGERVGLIRFGSRVDVELPEGARVEVARGQRVVAGQTVLARIGAGDAAVIPAAGPA